MQNFWQKLPKPFFVQAPMENVTDTVFRQVLAKTGKPDVFFTEFTNTNGMCNTKGRKHVEHRLIFSDVERPIVAQIWGNNPEYYRQTVAILKEKGFDGVDINMGCPVNNVVRRFECSGLICKPELAGEIIQATLDAAGDMPVSVKTRLGFKTLETEKWVTRLLQYPLSAIALHGRTSAEMSKTPPHWDEIGKAVQIRNTLKSKTLIIGNGDVKSRQQALEMVKTYGVDGVMIGRGIFENLWIFNKDRDVNTITTTEKLDIMKFHIELFQKTWGEKKSYEVLKKFFKIYISGLPNITEIRNDLMRIHNADETLAYLKNIFLKSTTFGV